MTACETARNASCTAYWQAKRNATVQRLAYEKQLGAVCTGQQGSILGALSSSITGW